MLIGKKIQYGSFPKGRKEVAQTYLWKHKAGGQVEAQNTRVRDVAFTSTEAKDALYCIKNKS